MKLKIVIAAFSLIGLLVLYSFSHKKEVNDKKWACTCNQVTNIHKASRAGNWVSISWNPPVGGSSPVNYSYVAYFNGGGSTSGTVGGSGVTLQDNNLGGTIVITTHCKELNDPGEPTCQSTPKNGTWTSGN